MRGVKPHKIFKKLDRRIATGYVEAACASRCWCIDSLHTSHGGQLEQSWPMSGRPLDDPGERASHVALRLRLYLAYCPCVTHCDTWPYGQQSAHTRQPGSVTCDIPSPPLNQPQTSRLQFEYEETSCPREPRAEQAHPASAPPAPRPPRPAPAAARRPLMC